MSLPRNNRGSVPLLGVLAISVVITGFTGMMWYQARKNHVRTLSALKKYEGFYNSDLAAWYNQGRPLPSTSPQASPFPSSPPSPSSSPAPWNEVRESLPINPFYPVDVPLCPSPSPSPDPYVTEPSSYSSDPAPYRHVQSSDPIVGGNLGAPLRCQYPPDAYDPETYQEGQPINFAATQRIIRSRAFLPRAIASESANEVLNIQLLAPKVIGGVMQYCGSSYAQNRSDGYKTCISRGITSVDPPPCDPAVENCDIGSPGCPRWDRTGATVSTVALSAQGIGATAACSWSNVPSGVLRPDALFGTCDSRGPVASNVLPDLQLTGFFAASPAQVPDNAIIRGIVLSCNWGSFHCNGNMNVPSVQLVKGGVVASDNRAGPASEPIGNLPSCVMRRSCDYGGPRDLWGTTWTPADLRDPGFGAEFGFLRVERGVSADVDYCELVVYWDPGPEPSPGPSPSPSPAPSPSPGVCNCLYGCFDDFCPSCFLPGCVDYTGNPGALGWPTVSDNPAWCSTPGCQAPGDFCSLMIGRAGMKRCLPPPSPTPTPTPTPSSCANPPRATPGGPTLATQMSESNVAASEISSNTDNPIGGWDSGGNARTNNNNGWYWAEISYGYSPYLNLTGYYTAPTTPIPNDAVIDGITVACKWFGIKNSGDHSYLNSMRLMKNGQPVGVNRGPRLCMENIPDSPPYTYQMSEDFGADYDTWGVSWTPAEINDPGFGVQIRLEGGLDVEDYIDYCRLRVYWHPEPVTASCSAASSLYAISTNCGTPPSGPNQCYGINRMDQQPAPGFPLGITKRWRGNNPDPLCSGCDDDKVATVDCYNNGSSWNAFLHLSGNESGLTDYTTVDYTIRSASPLQIEFNMTSPWPGHNPCTLVVGESLSCPAPSPTPAPSPSPSPAACGWVGAPERIQVTVCGVTNNTCTNCGLMNNTWTLTNSTYASGGCVWKTDAITPGTCSPHPYEMSLWVSGGTTRLVALTGTNTEYAWTMNSVPVGAPPFDMTLEGGAARCSNIPPTLRIEPWTGLPGTCPNPSPTPTPCPSPPSCPNCIGGRAPIEYQVSVSGVVNGSAGECNALNGDWRLKYDRDWPMICRWYSDPSVFVSGSLRSMLLFLNGNSWTLDAWGSGSMAEYWVPHSGTYDCAQNIIVTKSAEYADCSNFPTTLTLRPILPDPVTGCAPTPSTTPSPSPSPSPSSTPSPSPSSSPNPSTTPSPSPTPLPLNQYYRYLPGSVRMTMLQKAQACANIGPGWGIATITRPDEILLMREYLSRFATPVSGTSPFSLPIVSNPCDSIRCGGFPGGYDPTVDCSGPYLLINWPGVNTNCEPGASGPNCLFQDGGNADRFPILCENGAAPTHGPRMCSP